MDDFTQKSSMSLTQENPITAYAHILSFNSLDKSQTPPVKEKKKPYIQEYFNNDGKNLSPLALDRTKDCTGITFKENNEFHVKLNLQTEEVRSIDEQPECLNTPYATDQLQLSQESMHHFEPKTPALSTNPFEKRGSLMREIDLFAATQPSSVNHHFTSPVSSHPSPGTFCDFSSPLKRQKLTASPVNKVKYEILKAEETRKFKRTLSDGQQFVSTGVSGVRFIDMKSRIPELFSTSKLRPCISMIESQEKKSRSSHSSISEDSDYNTDMMPTRCRGKKLRQKGSEDEFGKLGFNSKLGRLLLSTIESPGIIDYVNDMENDNSVSPKIDSQENQELQSGSNPQFDETIQNHQKNSDDINKKLPVNKLNQKSSYICVPMPDVESQDLASLSCLNENSEPQLPTLQEKCDESLFAREEISRKMTMQETSRNKSSQVLMKKNCLYFDNLESVPETSPLVYQILPEDEVGTIPFKQKFNHITDEITHSNQDPGFESVIINDSSPGLVKESISKNKISLLQKSSPIQNVPSLYVSEVSESVMISSMKINLPLETNKIILPGENLQTEDYSNLRLNTNIHCSNSYGNAVYKDKFETIQQTSSDNNVSNIGNSRGELERSINQNKIARANNEKRCSEVLPTNRPGSLSKISKTTKKLIMPRRSSRKSERDHKSIASVVHLGDPSDMVNKKSSPYSSLSVKNSVINEKPRKTKRKSTASQSSSAKVLVRSTPNRRINKRREAAVEMTAPSTRSSKRQFLAHVIKEDSEDPLSAHVYSAQKILNNSRLFNNMAFAVSFVYNDKERTNILRLISENGGVLLEHGFDTLFEPISQADPTMDYSTALSVSTLGNSLSFAGVIADVHSRKTKYIQALALGLPCLSSRWIQSCINKNQILDWSPYLLCAGQSSMLGNAYRSRTLQPYPATEAKFFRTFAERKKILEGKSVLFVMGKGKNKQKRKAFDFLTHALGPTRVRHVTDITEARRILSRHGAKGQNEWDLLHVHDSKRNCALENLGEKCKRKFTGENGSCWPEFQRVRVITDEVIIQSLIFGELIEEII